MHFSLSSPHLVAPTLPLALQGKVQACVWAARHHRYFYLSPPCFSITASVMISNLETAALEAINFLAVSSKTTEKKLYNRTKKEINKGTCLGQCQTLLELLLSSNFSDIPTLYGAFSKANKKVLTFQLREDLIVHLNRAYLKIKDEKAEELAQNLAALNTACPDSVMTFVPGSNIDNFKRILDQKGSYLIVLYSERAKRSHAALFHISDKLGNFFYNSFHAGFYRYPTKDALLEGILIHLKAFHPWCWSQHCSWIVDCYYHVQS